jgi:L-lactate dehydrogenase
MSALRGAEAEATDIRYGTPLSSKVDVRDGDYDALADAGVVLIVSVKKGGAADRCDPQGRLRLLEKNAAIYRDVVPQSLQHSTALASVLGRQSAYS